ncbi:MAG TPA: NAD-dependent epimerase/dehydratase family protein, partial [Miltoncostaea sp.]|nr:NAD-dependent epimerase/dehydratase family protein [Miltoncostaea sp.]
AVAAAADGCEVVFNLAVSPRTGDVARMRAVNLDGARNAAAAARAAGARLVHASTAAVYGPLPTGAADEEHPARPERPYPASKLAAEAAVADATAGSGLPVTIARISQVYGPGARRAVGPYRAALRPVTPVVGDGTQLIDVVHVDDVVAGLRACAARTEAGPRVYNLAGGAPVRARDLLAAIAAADGRRLRLVRLPRAPFAALAAVNRRVLLPRGLDTAFQHRVMRVPASAAYPIGRAAAELGYRPAVPLARGVADTLAWYRRHGLIGNHPREDGA